MTKHIIIFIVIISIPWILSLLHEWLEKTNKEQNNSNKTLVWLEKVIWVISVVVGLLFFWAIIYQSFESAGSWWSSGCSEYMRWSSICPDYDPSYDYDPPEYYGP